MRLKVRRLAATAVMASFSMYIVGCSCSDCEERAIRQLEMLKSAIGSKAAACCVLPPGEQSQCLSDAGNDIGNALMLIPSAMDACQAEDWDRFREIMEEIRKFLPWAFGKPTADAAGDVVNSLPVFLPEERVNLFLDADAANTVDKGAVFIQHQVYSADAAANAELQQAVRAADVIRVRPTDPNPVHYTTYEIGDGSHATVANDRGQMTFTTRGVVEVSTFFPVPNSTDDRAALSDMHLVFSFLNETLDFHLDTTHPANQVVIDHAGQGVLTAVGSFSSTTRPFFQTFFDALVLTIPVTVTADKSGMILTTNGLVAADQIAPVDDQLTMVPPQPNDVPGCQDSDGNGIRDFADEQRFFIDEAIRNLCPDAADDGDAANP